MDIAPAQIQEKESKSGKANTRHRDLPETPQINSELKVSTRQTLHADVNPTAKGNGAKAQPFTHIISKEQDIVNREGEGIYEDGYDVDAFEPTEQSHMYAASNGIDEKRRLVLPTVRDAKVNKLDSGMMQTADPQTRERASRATNDTARSGILAGASEEDIDTALDIGRAVGRKIHF